MVLNSKMPGSRPPTARSCTAGMPRVRIACAVVLLAHGNGGNLSDRADIVRVLVDRLGASVMIFDYRGYGRSARFAFARGRVGRRGAARRWLAMRAGVDQSQIVLMGESLGGAVMVDLAASDGAADWCWRTRSVRWPTSDSIIIPGCPSNFLRQLAQFSGQDRRLSRSARADPRRRRFDYSHQPGPKTVCRRQRAQAVRRHRWRRPQRSVGR